MWQIPLAGPWIILIVAVIGVIGYYLGTKKQKKLAMVIASAIADGIFTAQEILAIIQAGKDVWEEIKKKQAEKEEMN